MRHLIIFLSIALLGNAKAQTFGLYSYSVNADNSVTITDYPTNAIGAIEIPATIDGRSVTSIGDNAFRDCSSLTSITIPDSVTSIGNFAFRSCSSLTSITIPNSVISIQGEAFHNCRSLTSFVVAVDNPNYSSMGSLLLNKNGTVLVAAPTASGDFTIPDSVTSIGFRALSGTGLTSITIPDSVTSIEIWAFAECSSLTSVIIGNSVTSIGPHAFFGCSSLTSVTIPDRVTSIGHRAFYNCKSLTSITIPDSVTSIGDQAFGAEAQYSLANSYAMGQGVAQDNVEAVQWYRKAAEQGHVEAQLILGRMYFNGDGVPEDAVETVKWVRKAAEQGYAKAQIVLANMYDIGQGVPKDYVAAYMWLNLAAAQGNEGAKKGKGILSEKMTKEQIAEAQKLSREWLAKRSSDEDA